MYFVRIEGVQHGGVRSRVCIITFQTTSIFITLKVFLVLCNVFLKQNSVCLLKNIMKKVILFILLSSLNHDNKKNQTFHFLLFILKFFLSIKKETKMRKVILFLLSELRVEFEHFKYYSYALAK